MKSKMKDRRSASCVMWTTTPRNDITLGDVHPSKLICILPGYSFRLFQYSCFDLRTKTYPKNFPHMDLGDGMDFPDIPWNCRPWWCFDLCIQHLENTLEGLIFNDSEWTMTFNNPKRNQISQFGLAVRGPMCVLCDTFCVFDHLTLAGFDVPEKVGCRVLLAFPREDNRRISVTEHEAQYKGKKSTHARQLNWYLISPFSSIITGGLKCL